MLKAKLDPELLDLIQSESKNVCPELMKLFTLKDGYICIDEQTMDSLYYLSKLISRMEFKPYD